MTHTVKVNDYNEWARLLEINVEYEIQNTTKGDLCDQDLWNEAISMFTGAESYVKFPFGSREFVNTYTEYR